jgi:hypothetical protein
MVNVKEDLTGRIFGRLTVLRQVEDYIYPDGKHRAQWLCECGCDEHNKVVSTGQNLKRKNGTKSCGCLRRENGERLKKQNRVEFFADYVVLWTNNTNKMVYFDVDDAEKILQYCWFEDTSTGYARTNINNKTITMHTFLGYKRPDHRNQNKLDNRKENLIMCTQKENNRNMPKRATNTSGFIGVSWHKAAQKWTAQITIDGKSKYLGCFQNKEDAIVVRLKAEKEYFECFAPQRHLFERYNI